MSVMIGHARGGDPAYTPGDQTGAEVRTQPWYAGGWTVLLRPKSPADAEKMAAFCEALCANEAVGYGQRDRNSLRAELQKVNWQPAAVKTPCNCDCSSFMSVCAEGAGIGVPYVNCGGGVQNAPVTWTIRDAFLLTGRFEALTDVKYLSSPDWLKRGDVLVNEPQAAGHTVMALSDGALAGTVKAEPETAKAETGKATAKAGAETPPETYIVQWGDTLSSLAARFGTTVEALAALNNIENPHIIYAGAPLRIPGGGKV